MPQIKNNFTLKSKSPNFDRDSFISKRAMKEMPTAWMDEGHISYSQEDGNHYVFSILNKFDTETGYFRLFKDSEELTEIQRDIDDLYARISNLPTGGGGNIPDDLMNILNDLIAKVNELYAKEYPVTCSLSYSGGILEYDPFSTTQTAHTIQLSYSVNHKGATYPAENIKSLTITGPTDCTIGNYDKTTNRVSVIVPLTVSKNYTFTLTVVTTDGQTLSKSTTVSQKVRSYARYSDSGVADANLFVAEGRYSNLMKSTLTTSLTDSNTNDFHFKAEDGIIPAGSYLWIMVPTGVGLPNIVKGNGYGAAMLMDENDPNSMKIQEVKIGSCTFRCLRGIGATAIDSQDMKITFKP